MVGVVVVLASTLLVVPNMMGLFSLSFGATPTATELPLETYPLPEMIDSGGAQMNLVFAGDFTMGSDIDNALTECKKYRPDCQKQWFEDENPSRVIYLDSFYIDRYEVSNALYRICEEAGGCNQPVQINSKSRTNYYRDPQFDNYPVIYVDWDMANAYCQWRGGYLPSEAQWEKGARGTNGYIYPWGNDLTQGRANFCDKNCDLPIKNNNFDDGYKDTAPVDEYPQSISLYNSYNMSGNVWEWVADWYKVYPGGDPTGSPYFEPEQTYRVIRGGSWDSSIDLLRTTNRDPRKPTSSDNNIGFRCAMDPTP
jgi:formylglycine-generating enzyme required for sulfatase activity